VTTVAAVKDALPVIFAAALPNSQVIDGPVAGSSITKSHVLSVGDVTGANDMSNFGMTSTTEQYTVQVTISVDVPGYLSKPARDAAVADWDACRLAVLADPSLGVGNLNAGVGIFDLREYASDNGRSASVSFPVSIFAA
jgi:hypothetical protein